MWFRTNNKLLGDLTMSVYSTHPLYISLAANHAVSQFNMATGPYGSAHAVAVAFMSGGFNFDGLGLDTIATPKVDDEPTTREVFERLRKLSNEARGTSAVLFGDPRKSDGLGFDSVVDAAQFAHDFGSYLMAFPYFGTNGDAANVLENIYAYWRKNPAIGPNEVVVVTEDMQSFRTLEVALSESVFLDPYNYKVHSYLVPPSSVKFVRWAYTTFSFDGKRFIRSVESLDHDMDHYCALLGLEVFSRTHPWLFGRFAARRLATMASSLQPNEEYRNMAMGILERLRVYGLSDNESGEYASGAHARNVAMNASLSLALAGRDLNRIRAEKIKKRMQYSAL